MLFCIFKQKNYSEVLNKNAWNKTKTWFSLSLGLPNQYRILIKCQNNAKIWCPNMFSCFPYHCFIKICKFIFLVFWTKWFWSGPVWDGVKHSRKFCSILDEKTMKFGLDDIWVLLISHSMYNRVIHFFFNRTTDVYHRIPKNWLY